MSYSRQAPPRWFDEGPPKISDSTRTLLERYSGVPPDQVEQHCIDVRNRAYAVRPYPCIGQWRFLNLFIGQHPLYHSEILPRMRDQGQKYLDLGCCFAQDIRRLVADGVDSQRCWATDLRLDFISIGFELFRDKDRLKTTFIEADFLDESTANPLNDLRVSFDIIGASSFFHLFSWNDQKQAARRAVGLLRPQSGSLIVGRQLAAKESGEHVHSDGMGSAYRHDASSWKRLWEEVSTDLNHEVRFEVETSSVSTGKMTVEGKSGPEETDHIMMAFTIRLKIE